MNTLIVFLGTFATVFALGFQSQNVNQGHYKAAMLTSFCIGGGNLVILRSIPDGNLSALLAYLLAGPIAIVASMWIHQRTLGRK